MSKPDIVPKTTAAGIAVDPRTLERVIPESRRPDGTVRKEIKIRPGFTPQEDVSRFRGSRQKQMDTSSLPKGHIIGWAPPPSASAAKPATASMSKSAKKNAKRKEKRDTQKAEVLEAKIKENWEDDDDDDAETAKGSSNAAKPSAKTREGQAAKPKEDVDADTLVEKLGKLDVR